MKKFMAIALSAVMIMGFASCAKKDDTSSSTAAATTETKEEAKVMSYADYVAADMDSDVVIKGYVQAKQNWWDGKIKVYLQDDDGAYFIYQMTCSEDDSKLLVPGTEIIVTGSKTEWSGEIEVAEGSTFEITGNTGSIYEAKDVTSFLGTDEINNYMNQKVLFTDMTVSSIEYANDQPGDDIYVHLTKDGADYTFCLEYYLNGSDEAFYNAIGNLEAGQVIDVEGFLYFYEGINTHITSVIVK